MHNNVFPIGPARPRQRGSSSPAALPQGSVPPIPVAHLRRIFDERPDPNAQARIRHRERVLRQQETIGALCLLLAGVIVLYFVAQLARAVLS